MTTPSRTIIFGYRAAAVVIHEDKVLLHRSESDLFWSLPGGKVEFFEASDEALKRDIHEEAGISDLQIIRLLWVIENFLKKQENLYHELELIYLCNLPPSISLAKAEEFLGTEHPIPGNQNLFFRWFPRTEEDLRFVPIQPTFLKTALIHLPESTNHIVNREF